MTVLDPKTCQMVCGEEGFCRRTYLDGGNVNTWSVGLTAASGVDVRKYIGVDASYDECFKQFVFVFNHYFQTVCRVLGEKNPSLEVLTGAVSFHWNTGDIETASWVGLWKSGDMETAERHFMEYDKPASILKRRQREANLIFRGEWDIQPCIEWHTFKRNRHIDWKSGHAVEILPSIKKALSR